MCRYCFLKMLFQYLFHTEVIKTLSEAEEGFVDITSFSTGIPLKSI